jgi:opacity protein-like surface antigen
MPMKRLLLLAAVLAFCFTSSHALADERGVLDPHVGGYIGAFGGYRFSGSLTDIEWEALGFKGTANNQKYDGGFLGGVKLGTWVNRYVGAQIEGWYSRMKSPSQDLTLHGPLGSATIQTDGSSGDSYTGAFNLMFRLPAGVLEPYVGVGAAVLHLPGSNFDSITPGLNVLAGLAVPLTEHLLAFGEFKYNRFRLEGTESEDGLTVSQSATFQPMAIVGGLSFEFGDR